MTYDSNTLSFRLLWFFSVQERKTEVRKVPVPPHRYTPLRDQWMKIFTPVVDHLKLQIRFNLKTKTVEIRVGNIFSFYKIKK